MVNIDGTSLFVPEWRSYMSKIVCDVCGTSYPDTADQCPICGCAKPEEAGEVKSYTYVKGGRFSKKNVNKRLKEKQLQYGYNPEPAEAEEEEEPVRSNRGLLIAVVLLLLAIIAIVAYLYINYWMDPIKPDPSTSPLTTTGPSSTDGIDMTDQTDPGSDAPGDIFCEEIKLDATEITLSNPGDGHLINYTLSPQNTTEQVSFLSDAPDVATVDENGKITAVSPGSAVITVTCGSASGEIHVVCDIQTEPSTEPSTEPPTQPAEEFKLRTTDMTMSVNGPKWDLYTGSIPNTSIQWWSGDESIATVDQGGVVTFVSPGTTKIYAKYNGVTYECIVRVKAE